MGYIGSNHLSPAVEPVDTPGIAGLGMAGAEPSELVLGAKRLMAAVAAAPGAIVLGCTIGEGITTGAEFALLALFELSCGNLDASPAATLGA